MANFELGGEGGTPLCEIKQFYVSQERLSLTFNDDPRLSNIAEPGEQRAVADSINDYLQENNYGDDVDVVRATWAFYDWLTGMPFDEVVSSHYQGEITVAEGFLRETALTVQEHCGRKHADVIGLFLSAKFPRGHRISHSPLVEEEPLYASRLEEAIREQARKVIQEKEERKSPKIVASDTPTLDVSNLEMEGTILEGEEDEGIDASDYLLEEKGHDEPSLVPVVTPELLKRLQGKVISPSKVYTLKNWQSGALCGGLDLQTQDELFLPEHELESAALREAGKICRACAVSDLCLQGAIENDDVGIRAGTTKKERHKMK